MLFRSQGSASAGSQDRETLQEWSGKRDSNPQPSAWKADALAVELFPHSGGAFSRTGRITRRPPRRSSPTVSLSPTAKAAISSPRIARPGRKRKPPGFRRMQGMVEGGGFEPPKSHDDRFTVCSLWPLGNPSPHAAKAAQGLCSASRGAGDGTRTRNLLITNQLLCQLSYASGKLLF